MNSTQYSYAVAINYAVYTLLLQRLGVKNPLIHHPFVALDR